MFSLLLMRRKDSGRLLLAPHFVIFSILTGSSNYKGSRIEKFSGWVANCMRDTQVAFLLHLFWLLTKM